MAGSRTIKVLTALLITMTLGALVLMALETSPIRGERSPAVLVGLATSDEIGSDRVIFATDVPVQPVKWRNVVLHATGGERMGVAERCHFVIASVEGRISSTPLWKRQMQGHHVPVPGRDWNADSIGVCLAGDFSRTPPTEAQMHSLLSLVRRLQEHFRIAPDRVYLYRDIVSRSASPGQAFPEEQFTDALVPAAR